MSMSTHVIGIRPPDSDWIKMKAIWDACKVAGVTVPTEVEEFFDGESPDPAGVVVKVLTRKWSGIESQGYEVDIETLPLGVKIIRFFNSW